MLILKDVFFLISLSMRSEPDSTPVRTAAKPAFAIAEAAVAVAGRFVTAVSFALDVAKDKAQRATEWLRDAFSE